MYLHFIDGDGSFSIRNPENISCLYFPLASETGLKSSVTPNLGGDSKIGQDSFLLEPVSAENLHNNRSVRNFWCVIDKTGAYSAAGASAKQESDKFSPAQDESEVTAGFMWHTLKRTSKDFRLTSWVTSFIPKDGNTEIMYITIRNESEAVQELTAYAAVPLYGRSADNIRDHRNVTSMLHRIKTTENGVLVCPTMSFDERGHHPNSLVYYAAGCTGSGQAPQSFYPTVEEFIGEGGTYIHPRAVYEQYPGKPPFHKEAGKEAMGAFQFQKRSIAPGETADYIVLLGIEDREAAVSRILEKYNTSDKVLKALEETKAYWKNKVNISFHTQNPDFDGLMKWISFQPFLRRLFGCSFLPHHDYGRGGRGWRDLWQDCLSLLLMDPRNVGEMIAKNYGGVRMDGTNATIIGDGDGHFIADRNGIARVWMDHGVWPLITTKLYIDQTGDVGILNKEVPYFKDAQVMRGTAVDTLWNEGCGNKQLTDENEIYNGSILEHLLIQQLTAFYEVGDHNICRLRGADWNDALDMASERGESVAFTCAYAGNLTELAAMLRLLEDISPNQTIELLEEIRPLLCDDPAVFDDIEKKHEILAEYTARCRHNISDRRSVFSIPALASNLIRKAGWLTEHLRLHEWLDMPSDEGWFNSYYDNHGNAVEGLHNGHVRMMLTGQVFSIMGYVATDEQIRKITKSADHYLYRKEIGGYRLNTDFHELKFDMGRMFGFAYGEKENGAVFSHMTVMYANALYRRGFVKEGFKALKSLADTALDFDASHIYPGLPEYFRSDGRGMYHYLTGAASWYMMTMITEVFGVRGTAGDLILYPKLLAEQFDADNAASVTASFAGKRLEITYINKNGKDFGSYIVASASCGNVPLMVMEDSYAFLPRKTLDSLSDETHRITVTLI
ncbi:MAG: cellobiose phosphorylase [Eubacteriales bacterium]|nr:cellobiose phosphorylase [Eubacteriales bacterium]